MTSSSTSPNKPLIDPEVDDLNQQFEQVQTLKEATRLYLEKAKQFFVDETSGGERERVEKYIKLIVELASPDRT